MHFSHPILDPALRGNLRAKRLLRIASRVLPLLDEVNDLFFIHTDRAIDTLIILITLLMHRE